MERIEYKGVVDKMDWPRGEWDNEPDKIQWQDEETGLPCLIVRNDGGSLCGYVGVAPGHPAYAKNYDDLEVSIHGGLTFANPCREDAKEDRDICHVPGKGEPDRVYWLGFDCAHYGDVSPKYAKYRDSSATPASGETYKNIAYVQSECRALAKQLKAMADGQQAVE